MNEHYDGSEYWDFPTIAKWCAEFHQRNQDWVKLETLATTREGRPILLLTLGADPRSHPTLWLDGGTHAMEWTGVMATIYALSEWSKVNKTKEGKDWFSNHAICVLPCISPDGYQWMHEGGANLRSSTRPPLPGTNIKGFVPQDVNSDGRIAYMRWQHPAGPFVIDNKTPMGIRFRKIHDDPHMACFLSNEGLFVDWDGKRWTQAPRVHGLDLNRNFPVHWNPFSMGGMDAGRYALSEPESRAVTDAVSARSGIVAALTNHTYTGALLLQPYRQDTPLCKVDLMVMERLGKEAIRGTNYKLMKVHPEFTYDNANPIVGVWADCLSTTMGIPAYTLELWDPFSFAGIENTSPAQFFRNPNQETVISVLNAAAEEAPVPWTRFEHPQLGEVEIGGFDYLRTVRNPPERLLKKECHDGFTVAEGMRAALPKIVCTAEVKNMGEGLTQLDIIVENHGFLSSVGLERAHQLALAPGVRLELLNLEESLHLISDSPVQDLGVLDGWGNLQVGGAITPVYPKLGNRGHRNVARWLLNGFGTLKVVWNAGRAGRGQFEVLIES